MEYLRGIDEEAWNYVDRFFVRVANKEHRNVIGLTEEEQNLLDAYHSYGLIEGDGLHNFFLYPDWKRMMDAYERCGLRDAAACLKEAETLFRKYLDEGKPFDPDDFRKYCGGDLNRLESEFYGMRDALCEVLSEYITRAVTSGRFLAQE